MKVYIVVRNGPEWTNIIKVFMHETDATMLANKKNTTIAKMKQSGKGDVFECLSQYDVVTEKLHNYARVAERKTK